MRECVRHLRGRGECDRCCRHIWDAASEAQSSAADPRREQISWPLVRIMRFGETCQAVRTFQAARTLLPELRVIWLSTLTATVSHRLMSQQFGHNLSSCRTIEQTKFLRGEGYPLKLFAYAGHPSRRSRRTMHPLQAFAAVKSPRWSLLHVGNAQQRSYREDIFEVFCQSGTFLWPYYYRIT
jgi:hypothetical protein